MSRAEEYERCLRQLQHSPPISAEIEPVVAIALIANLQLALRHPGNTGPSNAMVREFITKLTSRLPPEIWPVIQQGFDPRYDVAREEAPT